MSRKVPGEGFLGGCRAVWGVQGVPGRCRGGPEVLGRKKPEKRSCVAGLLRSNIQDFVQEVPVSQMAQDTPFRCLPI